MKRKVPKTGNVPSKKSKSTSNGDQTLSEGVKQFEEQEQKEFSGRFNAKLFRKKLNENDFISDYYHFLQDAKANSKIVAEYVEAGGQPYEIVQSLEKIDSNSLAHISCVLQVLQLVLIEIITNATQHTAVAVNGCGYLLKKQRRSLESLLQSTVDKYKKSALKAMTAVVALDSRLAYEVLKLFTSTVKSDYQLQHLTKFGGGKGEEGETVRTCYIHFIMAFLIEGNNSLIQNVVAKPELIKLLLRELHLDSQENIVLVLGTLKNFLLKNLSVSKVKKMQIFDIHILENMMKIYKSAEKSESETDPEVVQRVRASVHDFMTLLLTSYKFGVTLRCIGEKQHKYNGTPREILRGIKNPWTDDLLNHLASQILKACPELCELYFGTFKRALETDREELYVNILTFVQHVTNLLTPKVVLRSETLSTMSSKEVFRVIQHICLHPEILEKIKAKGLQHSSFLVRLITSNHLRVQLNQLGEYLRALEGSSYAGLPNVKLQVFGYIFQHYPPVDGIVAMLYQTINDKSLAKEDVLMHLECVIDILLGIVDICPAFIEKTSSVVNYLQILKPIYTDDEIDVERRSAIEQKTIRLMLLLDPQALSTDSEIFQQLFSSLLNVYLSGTVDAQRTAKVSLRDILLKSSAFESGVGEIDIWLLAFKSLNAKHLDVVKQFFVKTLLNAKQRTDEMEVVSGEEVQEGGSSEGILKILKNIENGDTIDGTFEVPIISTMLREALHGAGGNKQSNHIDKYLDEVVLRLVHFHPSDQLATFGGLVSKRKLLVENYLLCWFKEKKYTAPDSFAYPTSHRIFESISKGSYEKIDEMSEEGSSMLMTHVHEVLFLVNQLIRTKKITEESLSAAVAHVVDLLQGIKEQDNDGADLQIVLKYVLQSQAELFKNWKLSVGKKEIKITPLIESVVKFAQQNTDKQVAEGLTRNYRRKMLKQLQGVGGDVTASELETLDTFEFVQEEQIQLLDILRGLQKPLKIDLSARIVSNIIHVRPESVAKRTPLSVENLKFVEEVFVQFVGDKDCDERLLNTLCENFLVFLQHFHNHIGALDIKLVELLYSGEKQSKAITKLLVFLAKKLFKSHETRFLELLRKNFQKKEVTYPLLNEIVSTSVDLVMEKDLLNTLYQEFKSGIIKSIEKPQKAAVIYKECPAASCFLLSRAMPIKECQEFCRKVVKSDVVEQFQVELLQTMHTKAISGSSGDPEQTDQFVQNFVGNLLNFFHLQFKKADTLNVDYLGKTLVSWLVEHRLAERNWEQTCETMNWSTIVKNCLKLGMNEKGAEMVTDPQDLLLLLAALVEEFYPVGEYPDISEYYELALTHSQFFNVMLEKDATAKYPLVRVLFTLATRAEKRVFLKQHVPILLGSYSAKLHRSDRTLLALIHLYERNGTCLSEFQPFLWGEAAIAHYSLMGMESFDVVQTLEATSADQVFSLIDPDAMKYSLSNFPIWRCLDPMSEGSVEGIKLGVQEVEENSYSRLERLVEEKRDEEILDVDQKLVNRREKIFENCYDPAFFIPLTTMAFCAEFNSSPGAAAQNGMVAMALEALSSYDMNMRRGAGLALVRYRRQMQSKKAFLDLELWNQFFLATSKGLQAIAQKNEDSPRMSHISALFLGKLSIILTQPLVKMYMPLSTYISKNESFDFSVVPHFQQLFLSPDMEHQSYREFILETIQDGLKCVEDFDVLDMGGILEALLVFFSCPFANIDANLRILNIVNTIVRIPAANKILIEKYCIVAWLNGIIANLEPYFFDTVEALVHLLWNMYYSVQAARQSYTNATEVHMKLFYLLRKLVKVIAVGHATLKTNYKVKVFEKIVKLLRRMTAENALALRSISDTEIVQWIDMGRSHFVEGGDESAATRLVNELLYVKENLHMEFVESDVEFRERLSLQGNDVLRTSIVLELRELVIAWTNCCKSA